MADRSQMAGRIDDLIRSLGSREAFSARTGIPLASLDRYCRGDSDVPSSRLAVIAKAAGVTTDHLIFGVDGSPEVTSEVSRPPKMPDVAMIPLLDVVASAGPGIENPMPFALGQLPFPRVWLDRLGLPERYAQFIDARGDSMEPTIQDGAICLVDTRVEHARRDGVYVLVDGNSVRIKRIAIGWQGALTLISDNERYPTDTLAAPDAEALQVAGRVVWAGGEI